MKNRERLGSRLGFIMLSAGCAIGCGNVWKFPWMCGQNGGGSFMLLYIICLVVLGLPAMTMEFSVGRAAQASPIRMYQKLEKPGCKWGIFGIASLIGNIADGILHRGDRVDHLLFHQVPYRPKRRFRIYPDDYEPHGECGVFAGDRCGSICHFKL